MATVTDTTADTNGNTIIDVSSSVNDSITLATAGTYFDKNIVFNITMGVGFGDAEASDVAAGKTFTSSAGLKVTGTHECAAGLDTSDATATAGDILSGKTAYVNGSKVTGSIAAKSASDITASGKTVTVPAGYYASSANKSVESATQATPSISVDTSGKITATSEQSAGYVAAGTKSATKQLSTQAAQTITPGTADKTIASGKYLTGKQTVKGDANLVSGNIKSGVSIFGVSGSYEGSGGIDTSDATATADDIAEGKTAYINGEKITGTLSEEVYSVSSIQPADSFSFKDGTSTFGQMEQYQLVYHIKPFSKRSIVNENYSLDVGVRASSLGNATAVDVVSGKTFTSTAGLKVTGTMPSKVAETYTPGTADQTIAAGQYLSGAQTIKGDANLLAKNIRNGVSIFGVAGSYEGSSGGSSGRTLVSKSGTTQTASFDTGLSEIVAIVLKRSVDSTGLANASFVPLLATGTATGCSSYNTYMKNYATSTSVSNYCNVEGGTFHWTTTNTTYRFVDPKKYDWYAIGYE